MELLDPTIGIVFKTLLARDPRLLQNMLEAILEKPIDALEVLNPEIPAEFSDEQGITLKVRVRPKGEPGKADDRVNVAMQIQTKPGSSTRMFYFAARDFAELGDLEERFRKIPPTAVIFWVVEPLFEDVTQLHSIYDFREAKSRVLLTDELTIHLLQLSNLHHQQLPEASTAKPSLLRWARFLTAKTDADFERLAKEDPIMEAAKTALDKLSQDPEMQRLALKPSGAVER